MLDELTSTQLSEWEVYDRLEPIGEWRADFRMAYLSCIITNIARKIHGGKGVEMAVPLDFMPEWDKEESIVEPVGQTVEQMKQIMLTIAHTQNRKVETKKRKDKLKKKK